MYPLVATICMHPFCQNTGELPPSKAALANGDVETGVTLMRMVRKMDAGPLVGQEFVQITREDNGTSLRKKLADSCVPLIQSI